MGQELALALERQEPSLGSLLVSYVSSAALASSSVIIVLFTELSCVIQMR